MGPARVVNDLQPEQTEKSGLHNLTLKAYSPGYTRYTSKQLINLPLISPSALTNPPQRPRREGTQESGLFRRSYVDCTAAVGSA